MVPMGEEAAGNNGGVTAGKIGVGDTFDNGNVIGGAIPGVIVGGLVRSGDEAFGTESKNICSKISLIQLSIVKVFFKLLRD